MTKFAKKWPDWSQIFDFYAPFGYPQDKNDDYFGILNSPRSIQVVNTLRWSFFSKYLPLFSLDRLI